MRRRWARCCWPSERGHPPDAATLIRFTERTITDPAALAAEVAGVRRRGWAEAAGERDPELNAIAAPVFGRDGALAAIIGIQGPAGRFTRARMRALRPALLEAAHGLSAALGGAPSAHGTGRYTQMASR